VVEAQVEHMAEALVRRTTLRRRTVRRRTVEARSKSTTG
jgi:hypothetical protein